MLVIDSKELNQQIRDTETIYMEKSKEVLSSGQETEGKSYEKKRAELAEGIVLRSAESDHTPPEAVVIILYKDKKRLKRYLPEGRKS